MDSKQFNKKFSFRFYPINEKNIIKPKLEMKHFQITYKLRQFLIPILLRTQKISMHLPFIVIFFLSFWTRLCYNLTASIDLNSTYTFSSGLIKSQTLTLNGQEVVLILFLNGSISKLNDRLVFQQSIYLPSSITIVDFQISSCLNCTTYTPSIIAVHSQRHNFTLISLINTTHRVLFTWSSVITKIFPFNTQINSSSAYAFDIVIYLANELLHYRYINSSSTSKFFKIFTSLSMNDPVINIARYQKYFVFFTKYNYVNLYDAISLSIINSTYIPFSTLQAVFTDYPYVGLTQMTTALGINVAGSSLINSSVLLADSNLSSRIDSSSSYLKFIRPSPSSLALTPTSERIFIFHNQMIKVNMSSGYAYLSVLNNALNFSSSSNISVVFFQSSKIGFIHSSNDNKAYSYCQNITGTSCANTFTLCSQFDTNCRTCNSTSCITCVTSYNLVNGTCQPQCNITNCSVCDTLSTCRTCTSGYSLNSNSTNCTLIIANTTTNTTITDNTTIANTTNTTTITNITATNFTDNSTNITDTSNATTNPTNTIINSTTDNTINTFNSTNTTDSQNATNTTNPTVPDDTANTTTDTSTNTTTNTTTDLNTNQTNITAPTNTTNATTTDTPTIPTQNPSPPTSPFTEPASQQAITTIYSSFTPQTKSLVTTTSFLNSSPFYRLILAFLSPIFGLFDDYWFYIYHNNSFDHLVLFPRLLVFMYVVNQQRIIPDFLQETIDNCGIPQFISAQDSYKNYTSPRVLLIDQKPTFMQENFRQLLLGQWVLLILMFTLVKIITFFLKKWLKSSTQKSSFSQQNFKIMNTQNTCYKKHASIAPDKCRTILKVFTQYLKESISFKNILLCLLGSNLIFVSFQLGTQFQIFFSLASVDKINLIISLFLGLIFMIAFLVLVTLNQSLFEKVSHSDKKLTKKQKINKKLLKKLWHEDMEKVIFHCIKSCLYGFVHGYLLENNQSQYLMLILVKIILLILIYKYPNLFKHFKLAKLTMVYFIMGISLDFLCLVGKLNLFHSSVLSTVFVFHGQQVTILLIIQSSLLFIMFFSIISLVVVQLYYQLKHMLCLPSKSNKICNMSTMASSKPQTIFEVIQKVEQYENAYQTPENQKIELRKIQKFRRKVFVKDQTINGERLRKNDTDEDEAVIVKNKTAIGRVKKAIFAPNLIQSSSKPIFDSVDDQPFPTQVNSNFHSSFHKTRSFHRQPYPQLKSLKQSSLLTVTHYKK